MTDELTDMLGEYEPQDSQATLKKQRHKLLLIDDDPIIRSAQQLLFSDYDLIFAESGEQALKFDTDDVDCIVTDVRMTGMDGIKTAEYIREKNPHVRIVVNTAYPGDYQAQDVVNPRLNLYGYNKKGNDQKLKDIVQSACEESYQERQEAFFAHVTDPKERAQILNFCRKLNEPFITRVPEDHDVSGPEEAMLYCQGVTYAENADYILLPMELGAKVGGLEGKTILDFCTGPGGLANIMSQYAGTKVLGVDGSEHMLKWAREHNAGDGVTYVMANLFALDEMANKYPELAKADVVVCQNSMHHFSDETLYSFFEAGVNALKPGGTMYVADYRREELDPFAVADRLLATNHFVRGLLVDTFESSLRRDEIVPVLDQFGDRIEYKVFFPTAEYKQLQSNPEVVAAINADRHPHHMDYNLSLRVEIKKAD
jgi:2-polyprenyl-3-methyl-5-hydroxy-6-metoxy-1,4-benzoquinol methylase